ncbi:MAG: DUF1294 domain-containing protein [Eubacteriales bacterium]|nr:DUF1294 domain-containing protein [Eubacteriales bacterium]
MKMIAWYIAVSNLAAFLIYGMDKKRAKRHQWRIPERVLLGAAAIGGSVGALAGMYIFHHKTRKMKFAVGIPLIFILQLILFYSIFNR